MKKSFLYFFLFVLIGLTLSTSSCKKPLSFSNENLSFSQDTIFFDTVFTTIGSVTKKFKLYNTSNKTVNIEQMELIGGSSSSFRINVDGVAGTFFDSQELKGNDSLFIFVEVTLDPNNLTNPMVIEDQVRFRTNGKDQFVTLVAWGQDAYFHYSYISANIFDINSGTWPNDKPHVIYGAAFIDSAETLNIEAGTEVFLHKNAALYVYKGTLNINGSLGNEVTFQGDRLEAFYDDVSGQYFGIFFDQAFPSTINYAIIKNGTSGIQVNGQDPSATGYTLTVTNTIVNNCSSYGIFLYNGDPNHVAGSIKAENCILSKNGVHSFIVLGGGAFNFNHCTLLGYGTGENVSAAVGISNFYGGTGVLRGISEGTITNSLMYGNLEYELAIDTVPDIAVTLNFDFQFNLIKSATQFTSPIFHPTNNIWEADPLLMNIEENDFHFFSTSPLNNSGGSMFPVTSGADIEGVFRTGPDIGAYEAL